MPVPKTLPIYLIIDGTYLSLLCFRFFFLRILIYCLIGEGGYISCPPQNPDDEYPSDEEVAPTDEEVVPINTEDKQEEKETSVKEN